MGYLCAMFQKLRISLASIFRVRLLVLVLLVVCSGTVSGQSRKSLERKKKKLEQDIAYTNRLLQQTKAKQEASVGQLQQIRANMQQRQELIQTLSSELGLLDTELDNGRKELERLQGRLDTMLTAYAGMVRQAYLHRRSYNRWLYVLGARDMGEALRRSRYFQRVEELRNWQVQNIRQTREGLALQVQQLDSIRWQKKAALDQQASQSAQLAADEQEKARLVASLKGKERTLMEKLKQSEREATKLAARIEEIIRKELEAARKREEEARKKREAAAKAAGKPAALPETPESVALSRDFVSNKGKLPWPVKRGVVAGKFGKHAHPVFEHVSIQRDGIDIHTQAAEAVLAVFGGEVSAVFRLDGYEQVVIVRHGSYLTVYANLSEVKVGKGQKVNTGAVLGSAYYDAEQGKAMVHFRVMNGQAAENPQVWLAKR